MTPEELLRKNGIHLSGAAAPGQHYIVCPQCSHKRKPENQKLKCLGIKIGRDGSVCWGCNHCMWSGPQSDREPFKAYPYRDSNGALIFRKVRNPPGSENRFYQQRWTGAGWANGTEGADTLVLYRADEIARAIAEGREIVCAEGEKDVDNLWALGIAATCNAAGASVSDVSTCETDWTD